MTRNAANGSEPDAGTIYQIRVRGHLGPQWANWFAGMAIHCPRDGETTLTGPVADQAALHGLIRTVRDLGLPLVSITQLESNRPNHSGDDDRLSGPAITGEDTNDEA